MIYFIILSLWILRHTPCEHFIWNNNMKKKKSEKRYAKKIIEALKEPVPLSINRGTPEPTKFKWASKKDRRHDGRVTPKIIYPGMKWSEIIENAIEPEIFWDDWIEYRDGFRDNFWFTDEDKKQEKEKIKKQIKIRKARKQEKCRLILC